MQKEILTKRNNVTTGLVTLFFSILCYLAYLLNLYLVKDDTNYDFLIFIYSWLGIFLALFVCITWYKITGSVFTLYTIFMLFFFLFNFGQPIMWALGIHDIEEIGQTNLYKYGKAESNDIVNAQAITLISILMFHLGAIFSFKKEKTKNYYLERSKINTTLTLKAMYIVSIIIGFITIPLTLVSSFNDFQIASVYGYQALYYSEFAKTGANITDVFLPMFFPVLVGLLLGSKYNKKVMFFVYSVFITYLTLNLLAGDRGTWIYKLVILIWLSHTCYKAINLKKFLTYILFAILGLYIIDGIVSLRNIGISFNSFIDSFSLENSVISGMFFEMGSSMTPVLVLQKFGWDVWPYENSYLLALLGMVTNQLIYLLGLPFDLVSSWFSQDYLGISWGAGFSIVAEAMLNFGPFFGPLFMVVLGFLITSLIYLDKHSSYLNAPFKFLFAASTLHAFVPLSRNFLHLILKDWFYGVLLFCILVYIVKKVGVKRKKLN
jgi:oligosaccharide repeat unit polymerase